MAADFVAALVVVVAVVVVRAIVPATVVAMHPIGGRRADVVGTAAGIVVDIAVADIAAADTVAVDTVEVAIVDCRKHSVAHHRLHSAATNRNCHPTAVHRSVLNKCCLIWRMRMPQ